MRYTNTSWTLVALALIGCAGRQPPRRVAAEHVGPIRSRDVGGGEAIFTTLCTACHAGRVNPRGYHWTPGHMRHQIREGNALMPPIPEHRLSDAQVEAVIAYLSTVGAVDGLLPSALDAGPDAPTPAAIEPTPAASPAEAPAVGPAGPARALDDP